VPPQVPRARLLTLAATVLAALCLAAGAVATTGSKTANGFTVTASLSPDSVTRGGVLTAAASVTNVTGSSVRTRLTIGLTGPDAHTSSTYLLVLKPSGTQSFVRHLNVPAPAASGVYTLTVTAVNDHGGSAQTTATAGVG
jgi:hypothetical protein